MNTKYLNARKILDSGQEHIMAVHGSSMTPIIKSGAELTFLQTKDYVIGDVVMCKVNGNWMVHKITKIANGGRYMISNNKGRDNGWTRDIVGRVIAMDGNQFGRKHE